MPEPYPTNSKAWLCKRCGFVVGLIRETPERVSRLDVFRRSRETVSPIDLVEADPFAVEDLDAGTVRCSRCGNRQEWHASERALERMMARRKVRTFGLEPT
ncbi:MAG: hypothetical protein CVU44_11230 [Chloroflexi bacterium HGW-Chloroflexi-6]|nr:MAG: hypothetical protein CVU44_11230 [Chloroflexi bacterium HGW-Chloroflexi-6]